MHSLGSTIRFSALVLFPLAACVCGVRADVVIETVPVGDLGNVPDTRYSTPGYGDVDYTYGIGKFEVTAGQYCEFLNAVAATDTYGLYALEMWSNGYGCKIDRTGEPGAYAYTVAPDRASCPVNYVTFWDACRFANWLHNGQPTGYQDSSTTEDGAYTLDGHTGAGGEWITRDPGATWVIPAESEWYKAAYYKGGGTDAGYWGYATQSDSPPMAEAPPGTDDVNGSANYDVVVDALTAVGAYTFKPSGGPYGTFDQAGNVWEWNEAVIGDNRGMRGGGFHSDDYNIHASCRYTISPTNAYYYFGFRVAYVPEPSLVGTDPPVDGTLSKTQSNVILLTFDSPIELPSGPPLSVTPIGGGQDEGDWFLCSVEPDGVTLKAVEDGPVLLDRTWYRIVPTAGFEVEPFTTDLCTLRGDANGSGRVTTADYSEVKAHMGEITDDRCDLNGTGRVTTADYIVVKDHMGNRAPAKP